jgi:hypothetical protein
MESMEEYQIKNILGCYLCLGLSKKLVLFHAGLDEFVAGSIPDPALISLTKSQFSLTAKKISSTGKVRKLSASPSQSK